MKFVKLTMPKDVEIFVNLDLVRDIHVSNGNTTISFDNEYHFKVKETPEEIFKIANAHTH